MFPLRSATSRPSTSPTPTPWYKTVKCKAVRYKTVKYKTVQYKTVNYKTVKYKTVNARFWHIQGSHSQILAVAHIRQSQPDSSRGCQVKVLNTLLVVSFSIGNVAASPTPTPW